MTKIIGLTGGIGSGKSTVARMFSELGVPVYIADTQAKAIMDLPEVISEVQSIFSQNIIQDNGKLDRKKIASIVFKSPEKLKELNQIIHPKVKDDFKKWLTKNTHHPYIIKEVAILFETKSEHEFDQIILVTAPLEQRIDRVLKRDNTTTEDITQRIKNQLTDQEKIAKSNFIIVNTSIDSTQNQVKKIHDLLNI